ncbi:MAG TPA: choice-of-anchor Q domain-containing protein, partial [Polyangium sp.]|nr:choice-of-anchor Q domain-containing protein [Polyangium sp.]
VADGGSIGNEGFRNNIVRAGACLTSKIGFSELVAMGDPRIFQNNLFDTTNPPTALYLDENTQTLTMPAQIDALMGTMASSTLSGDPKFMMYPADVHLNAGSPCINAGTATGAPAADYYGRARDAMPDIGPSEF